MENHEKRSTELEDMRQQIALLQNKLDKEPIISEKLLRDTMKRKANIINANAWIGVGASIFVILWAFLLLPNEGFSWWFVGFTVIMMLVCDFFTWKYHKNINKQTMNGDLVTVATIMKQLKNNYLNWLKYGIMMIGIWFIWLVIEFCFILQDWKLELFIIAMLLISLAIGCFIGLRMHRSVIKNADDIIKQIEE